jgi:hypothetical protein
LILAFLLDGFSCQVSVGHVVGPSGRTATAG